MRRRKLKRKRGQSLLAVDGVWYEASWKVRAELDTDKKEGWGREVRLTSRSMRDTATMRDSLEMSVGVMSRFTHSWITKHPLRSVRVCFGRRKTVPGVFFLCCMATRIRAGSIDTIHIRTLFTSDQTTLTRACLQDIRMLQV